MKALREILVPAAEYFKPDLVLVSAGFDAHWHDLALNASYDGFSAMTQTVQQLADNLCGGRLAFILEGGYNLESLSRGVHSVLPGRRHLNQAPEVSGRWNTIVRPFSRRSRVYPDRGGPYWNKDGCWPEQVSGQ